MESGDKMSKQVEERVVKLSIDNRNFESQAKASISILDKLKAALNLKGIAKGFDEVDDSMKDMSKSVSKNIEPSMSVLDKFKKALKIDDVDMGSKNVSKSMNEVNQAISKGSSESMSILDRLKAALHLGSASVDVDGVRSGMTAMAGVVKTSTAEIEDRVLHLDAVANDTKNSFNTRIRGFSLDPLKSAIDQVNLKFDALGVAGVVAISRITNKALDAGKSIVSSLTIDPMKTGFGEYELGIDAAQQLINSSGRSMEDVEKTLQNLNRYADKTIYKFTDMTTNLPKFVNAGLELEESAEVMQGIFNAAGLYGLSTQKASNAMYNIAQAYGVGYMSTIDWKSLENAGLNSTEFKKTIIEIAEEMGTLNKVSEGVWQTLSGNEVTVNSFRENLKDAWFTADVMTAAFNKYSDTTQELGKRAEVATTEVKTWSQMLDVAAEDAGSSWADTMKIIFGTYEESKAVFSAASRSLGQFMAHFNDARNDLLRGWKDLGGRQDLIDGLSNIWKVFVSLVEVIEDAVKRVFGKLTPQHIKTATEAFKTLTETLTPPLEVLQKLNRILEGLFSILNIGKAVISGALRFLDPVLKIVFSLANALLNMLTILASIVIQIKNFIVASNVFTIIANNIINFISAVKAYASYVFGTLFGKSLKDAILDAVYMFTGIVVTIGEALDYTVEYFTGYSLSSLFQNAKDSIVSFLTTEKSIGDYLSALQNLGDSIKSFLETIAVAVGPTATKIGSVLAKVFWFVADTFMAIFSFVGSVVSSAMNLISGEFSITTVSLEGNVHKWSSILDFLKAIWTGIKNAMQPIAEALGDIWMRIEEQFTTADGSIDITKISMLITSVLTGGLAISIKKFIDWLGGLGKQVEKVFGIKDIIASIKKVFDSLKEAIDETVIKMKAAAVMDLAKAIAILTASLVVLTLLDTDKATNALAAILSMLGTVGLIMNSMSASIASGTSSMVAFEKQGGNFKGGLKGNPFAAIASAFVALAVAIGVMVAGVAILANYNLDALTQGVTLMGIMMGLLTYFAKQLLATKTSQKDSKQVINYEQTEIKQILASAAAVILIAFAVKTMAKAVAKVAEAGSPDQIYSAGLVMIGLLSAVGAIIGLAFKNRTKETTTAYDSNKTTSEMGDFSKTLLAFSVFIGVLAHSVTKMAAIAMVDPAAFASASASIIAAIGVVSLLMVAVTDLFVKGNADSAGTAAMMESFGKMSLAVSGALILFSIAIANLAAVGSLVSSNANAIAFIVGTLSGFALLMVAMFAISERAAQNEKIVDSMSAVAKSMLVLSGTLIVFSVAVGILAGVGSLAGEQGIGMAIAAIVAFGALMLEIALLGADKDIDNKKILLIAASMAILAGALVVFSGAVATLATAGAIAGPRAFDTALVTIIAFGAIAAGLAVISSVFPNFDGKKFILMATGVVILAAAVNIISAAMVGFASAMLLVAQIPQEQLGVALTGFAVIAGAAIAILVVGIIGLIVAINAVTKMFVQITAFVAALNGIGTGLLLVAGSFALFAVSLAILQAIGPGVTATIVGIFTGVAIGIVSMLGIFGSNVDVITKGIYAIMVAISQAMIQGWPAVSNMIVTLFGQFLGMLGAMFVIMLENIGDWIINTCEWLIEFLPKLDPYVGQLAAIITVFIIDVLDAIGTALDDNADKLTEAIKKILKAVIDVILSFFGVDEDARSEFWSFIDEFWTGITTWAENFGKKLFEWNTTLKEKLNELIASAAQVFNNISGWLNEHIWTPIKTWLERRPRVIRRKLTQLGKKTLGAITDEDSPFNNIPGTLIQLAQDAINGFINKAKEIISDPLSGIQSVGDAIFNGFSNALTNWQSGIDELGNWFGNTFLNAGNEAMGIQSPSKETYWQGLMASTGFANGVEENGDQVEDAGKGLGDKLKEGISSAASNLKEKGKAFLDEKLGGLGLDLDGFDLSTIGDSLKFDTSSILNTESLTESLGSSLGDVTSNIDTSAFTTGLTDATSAATSSAAGNIDLSKYTDGLTGEATLSFDNAALGIDSSSFGDALSSATNTSIANAAGNIDYSPFEEATRETKDYVNKLNSGFYGEMYNQDEARALKKQDRQQMLDSMRKAFIEASKSEDEAIRKHGINGLRKLETFEKQMREGFFDSSKDGMEAYKQNLNTLIHTYNNTNRAVIKYNAALEEVTVGNATTTTKSLVDTFSDTTDIINDYAEKLRSGYFKTSEHASEWTHERTQMIKGIKSAFAEAAKSDDADIRQWGEQGLKKYEQFIAGYRTGLYDDTAEGLEAYNYNLNALIRTFNNTQKVVRETNAVTASEAKASASALSDMSESTSELGSSVNSAFGDETDSSGNIVKRYKVYINGQEASKDIQSLMELFKDNPTITPVVNLDEVTKGVAAANELFLANGWTKTYRIGAETANMTASLLGGEDHLNREDINGLFTTLREIKEEVATLGDRIDAMDVILDSGAVVGGIAPQMDSALGQKAVQSGRERYSRY